MPRARKSMWHIQQPSPILQSFKVQIICLIGTESGECKTVWILGMLSNDTVASQPRFLLVPRLPILSHTVCQHASAVARGTIELRLSMDEHNQMHSEQPFISAHNTHPE